MTANSESNCWILRQKYTERTLIAVHLSTPTIAAPKPKHHQSLLLLGVKSAQAASIIFTNQVLFSLVFRQSDKSQYENKSHAVHFTNQFIAFPMFIHQNI